MSKKEMVRITSLAKTVESIENTVDNFLGSEFINRTSEEKEAFKEGFKTAFFLLRKEFGIEVLEK